MKVTEILKNEHEVILNKIDHAVAEFETSEWKSTSYWDGFLLFLKNYADDYHHAKEEKIYFEWMKEKNPGMEHGPLHCMLIEHDESRRVVQNAEELLSKLKDGSSDNWDQFKTYICEYAQVLRSHIDKENNVLYNMADGLDQDGEGDMKMSPLFQKVEDRLGESVKAFL